MEGVTRRKWAATALAAPLLNAATKSPMYAVIGAGVFGACTAYELRRRGHNVTLIDQYGPASSRASSGGESRIIRAAYGPDEIYTHMAVRSLELWTSFFARSGRDLLRRTGVLWIAKPDNINLRQSRDALRHAGAKFQDLAPADLKRRFPQFRVASDAIAIFEPDSGALMARQAVAAIVDQFVRDGGMYRQAAVAMPTGQGKLDAIRMSGGESVRADAFVFACGPWLGKVFPNLLGNRIFPTRQEVLFFGIPAGDRRYEPSQMPVWIDYSDDRGMYGFPDLERRGVKVACDLHGPPMDPDSHNRLVSAESVAAARAYVADRFPALAHMPIVESRVCQYENTSNGDFLIDRHPGFENVWIVGGGSGHGFKHGPAVGEYAAARVTGAETPRVEPRFSLATKATEQNRSVH